MIKTTVAHKASKFLFFKQFFSMFGPVKSTPSPDPTRCSHACKKNLPSYSFIRAVALTIGLSL